MDKIWLPDSYFLNSKYGTFHQVTTNNIMIMLDPGGRVKYNARWGVLEDTPEIRCFFFCRAVTSILSRRLLPQKNGEFNMKFHIAGIRAC